MRLHIEFLWFKQFGYESVLIRRLLFQFIGLLFGLSILISSLFWQNKWFFLVNNKRESSLESNIKGWKYTLSITFSYCTTILIAIFLSNLAYLSIINPFDLLNESILLHLNPKSGIIGIICSSLISLWLITKKNSAIYCVSFAGILLSIITCRLWGLWGLGLAIPDSNIIEPLHGADVSFALARFPALQTGLILITAYLALLISTAAWNKLTVNGGVSDWMSSGFSDSESKYIKPIISLFLISIGCLLWLSRHSYLWTQNGATAGANWLDVHFNIPLRSISTLLIFLFVALLILGKTSKSNKKIKFYTAILSIFTYLLEFTISPLLQWIVVRPRELNLETPYISRSIQATRRAFQLDSIKTELINPRQKLTSKDLTLGASTLRNIRLWDSQPLLATNRQLQQLRVYYRFSSASVDRYKLKKESNERQQVIISARELDQASLPKSSRTWLNRHFVFTHGYGFTLSPVNTMADDGLPDYFIRDLGSSRRIEGSEQLKISRSDVINSVPINRAALYFGMYPSPYAIAPTKQDELDYPEGDQNIYNRYKGSGGIPLSTIFQKIAASVYLQEPRLLNTGILTPKSRLLIRREVRQRVKAIAPFVKMLGDPYMISVVINERDKNFDSNQNQYWIVEGYTQSNRYPYGSDMPNGANTRYIRNSVKAVVDAYNGDVQLYISEPKDPMILGWSKLFPNLLKPIQEMPKSIKAHLKVPTELFTYKVQQLLRYHVTDSRTFYNGDDVWQIPMELYGREQVPVAPYHITAQLQTKDPSEFLLLQPISPLARPNLSAWLAARNDGSNYGDLVLLRFPSQKVIYGPEQIQALINQNPTISEQFSLWDRAGSQVIQGNLLVLPLGRSLLYVEPVYLKASKGGLPTLTRVVLSDGRKIIMAKSLSEGLKLLVSNQD